MRVAKQLLLMRVPVRARVLVHVGWQEPLLPVVTPADWFVKKKYL